MRSTPGGAADVLATLVRVSNAAAGGEPGVTHRKTSSRRSWPRPRRAVDVRQQDWPLAAVARDPAPRTCGRSASPRRCAFAPGAAPSSPSASAARRRSGILRHAYDPAAHATSDEAAGAAAIPVLTEPTFFDGASNTMVPGSAGARRIVGDLKKTMVALAIVSMGALAVTLDAQQGQERGGAAAAGQGAGRGTVRPECVNPKIPAAECNVGATPINWADPPLGDGPFLIESARQEHRNLRVVVMARLRQPWSIAFLPDNAILVTERGGQLRIIRNGVLDPAPVAGTPAVHASGLQGLMDVVLHPRFAENHYIYLAYHKPVKGADGSRGGRNDSRTRSVERDGAHGRPRYLRVGRYQH